MDELLAIDRPDADKFMLDGFASGAIWPDRSDMRTLIARLRAAETQRDKAVRLLRRFDRDIGVLAFLARVDGEQTP